jgi:hypothetical protein
MVVDEFIRQNWSLVLAIFSRILSILLSSLLSKTSMNRVSLFEYPVKSCTTARLKSLKHAVLTIETISTYKRLNYNTTWILHWTWITMKTQISKPKWNLNVVRLYYWASTTIECNCQITKSIFSRLTATSWMRFVQLRKRKDASIRRRQNSTHSIRSLRLHLNWILLPFNGLLYYRPILKLYHSQSLRHRHNKISIVNGTEERILKHVNRRNVPVHELMSSLVNNASCRLVPTAFYFISLHLILVFICFCMCLGLCPRQSSY